MPTIGDVLTMALQDAGVLGQGQLASAEDLNNALTRVNWLLGQWNRKRWLVYHLVDSALTSTGAQSYTVGVGGDFDQARPDRLEGAYVRQLLQAPPNRVDYQLGLLQSMEDYSRIILKQLQSVPRWVFYDSGYPLGRIYVWPVPQATLYEVHVLTKAVLTEFSSLADELNLPDEYSFALYANIKKLLRNAYRLPPDKEIEDSAQESLNVLRGANTQVPTLKIPSRLLRRYRYNIWSDSGR